MKAYLQGQIVRHPIRESHRRAARIGLALAVMVGAWGCSASGDPGTDSTTHFWMSCEDDSECGGGTCICGRCTRACEANSECALDDARCVRLAEVLACEVNVRVCVPVDSSEEKQMDDQADASLSDETGSSAPDGQDASASRGGAPSGVGDVDASLELPSAPATSVAIETDVGIESSSVTAPTPTSTSTNDVAPTNAVVPTTNSDPDPSISSASTDDTGLDVSPDMAQAYLAAPWWVWEAPQVLSATGCELSSSAETESVCEAQWSCAERDYDVHCDFSDRWSCSCRRSDLLGLTNFFSYDVWSVSGQAACQAAFDACTDPDAEHCLSSYVRVDPDSSCQWETNCSVLAGEDGLAITRGPLNGYCSDQDGYAFCSCPGSNSDRSFIVQGAEGEELCTLARASCESDQTPTTWHLGECQPLVEIDTTDICWLRRDCPASAPLSTQVTALAATRSNARCVTNDDDSVTCECDNELGGLRWTNFSGEVSLATCESALDVCERVADIEFTGEPVCGGTTGTDYPTGCSRDQGCSQSGTVDGQEFTFETSVSLDCGQTISGDWMCDCQAGPNYLRYRGVWPEDEASVCEQGFAACRAELTTAMPPVPTPP